MGVEHEPQRAPCNLAGLVTITPVEEHQLPSYALAQETITATKSRGVETQQLPTAPTTLALLTPSLTPQGSGAGSLWVGTRRTLQGRFGNSKIAQCKKWIWFHQQE